MKHIEITKDNNKYSSCNCCLSKNNLVKIRFAYEHSVVSNVVCLCENCLQELKEVLNNDK